MFNIHPNSAAKLVALSRNPENLKKLSLNAYVSVHSQSNMAMSCLKKLISQPRVVEKSPFLAWRTLTHNILMSVIFGPT